MEFNLSEYSQTGCCLPEDAPAHRVSTIGAFDPSWLKECSYALINPIQVEHDDWAWLPCEPLTTPNIGVREHLLPQLVYLSPVSGQSKKRLESLIAKYEKRGQQFLSALLNSTVYNDEMATHLRSVLEQRRYGSRRHWWFRCYDPRVFSHLCWILNGRQMDRLLGPIQSWIWHSPGAGWHRIERASQPTRTVNVPLLEALQWAFIDRISMLNKLVGRLQMLAPHKFKTFSDYRWLDTLLQKAQSTYGLSNSEDQCCFAQQAAQFHPLIHHHPAMQQRLSDSAKPGISYTELCEDLSDQALKEMVRQMELETTV